MKISKEDFESMQSKYDKEVKKGKPAKGTKDQDKTNQTKWIFFDRETLEGLLAQADKDPKVGGIQFYFTEHTDETAEKAYPKEGAAYTGQMTLVMRAANLNENKLHTLGGTEDEYQGGRLMCPYNCEPEPTSN
ncbi:molecular chaperone DnaK [uncultured Algoriphagus sp.]|uniref:molecular chaperone DnaK n=1 Tax=uncultured Algoriphagus sp. TaxID=417365 RepID=UPI0030EC5511|tara:strand:- start:21771 stop:22169 length:399 start_codon:yes stop_codon:yes gene_type:complete